MKTLLMLILLNFSTPKESGVVKFYSKEKGFGYITADSNKSTLFVHITGLAVSIRPGDRVIYNTELGPKGPYAVNVEKYD
jgi:cold shock protein